MPKGCSYAATRLHFLRSLDNPSHTHRGAAIVSAPNQVAACREKSRLEVELADARAKLSASQEKAAVLDKVSQQQQQRTQVCLQPLAT